MGKIQGTALRSAFLAPSGQDPQDDGIRHTRSLRARGPGVEDHSLEGEDRTEGQRRIAERRGRALRIGAGHAEEVALSDEVRLTDAVGHDHGPKLHQPIARI